VRPVFKKTSGEKMRSLRTENRLLVQLFVQRPLPWSSRMGTDVAEFLVKSVQLFAQEPHYLHAKITVLP
jgi:hypothetical protein